VGNTVSYELCSGFGTRRSFGAVPVIVSFDEKPLHMMNTGKGKVIALKGDE
jgi:hypothetical protein